MNIDDFKRLPSLNLPAFELKLETNGEEVRIYDPIRRKSVILTPEEYVRQNFVNWLVKQLRYPASLIANETSIRVNDTLKRCDTVVFNRRGEPLMIVEYKAPHVSITQETFDQIVRYNLSLKARYLVVSNGLHHYCCVIDYKTNTYNFIPEIPNYSEAYDGTGQN